MLLAACCSVNPSPASPRPHRVSLICSLHRKEIARGLFEIGIWLHPDETKAMFEVIDEDDGGTIDVDEFTAFWDGYCDNTWDDDKDGIDF